jgi:hypothetical protein
MKKELRKLINSLRNVEENLLRLQTIQLTVELANIDMSEQTLLNSYIEEYPNNFEDDNNELYTISMSLNNAEYKLNLMVKHFKREQRRLEKKIASVINDNL